MLSVYVCAPLVVKALVTAIEHVDHVCREEAERSFAAGVEYTDEEETARQQAL